MENKIVRTYKNIRQDYAFDASIFTADEESVRRLKFIINNKLSQVDRTIILLYIDCQSYRKLAKQMNLSHMTIRREVLRIKDIILKEYNR